MSHWYHRNILKATGVQNFDLQYVASGAEAIKICSNLRQYRAKLLQLMCNPNEDIASLVTTITTYISVLQGFIISVDGQGSGSKLRHLLQFRWTDTCLGDSPCSQYDAVFEECSMLANMAMWYMKHAAKLAGKEDITMDEAKEVHKSLRLAAGIFNSLKVNYTGGLREKVPVGGDLDPSVLSAYTSQCLAEAQEVTVARAIELKHKPSLVSALCYDTAQKFAEAANELASLPPPKQGQRVVKWHRYLQLKQQFYGAYAYSFYGEMKLTQDECGLAISCLREAETLYKKSLETAKQYSESKAPGVSAKPHEHMFFRRLEPVIRKRKEKAVHENGFIYHHNVPESAPKLDQMAAEYGTVSPEDFTAPPLSPDWTPNIYLSFDITKYTFHQPAKNQGDLPPVKEAKVHQSSKEPKTESGCILS